MSSLNDQARFIPSDGPQRQTATPELSIVRRSFIEGMQNALLLVQYNTNIKDAEAAIERSIAALTNTEETQ